MQVFGSWKFAAQVCTQNVGCQRKKQSHGTVGGEREVSDVRFVMGVFTFYFVDLQSNKFIHHQIIILIICTYCNLLARIATLESQ